MERSTMSWVGKIKNVKMAILPRAIYRSMQCPAKFFTDLERIILSFMWKIKIPRMAKTILYNKETSGGIIIPAFKLFYRATILKIPGIVIKTDRRTNGIKSKVQIKIHTPTTPDFWQAKKSNGKKRKHLQ